MKVRKEIEQFAYSADKPVLRWLFDRYHWESQWEFVATCHHERYGTQSYQTHRVWRPTKEGRVLYASGSREEALENRRLLEEAEGKEELCDTEDADVGFLRHPSLGLEE